MHLISIDASPKQLSRLRNGHKVRIKKGTGFNLVVSPMTYHRVSRTFSKSKGVDVQLTPEEIDANKMYSPERHAEIKAEMDKLSLPAPAEGTGIFSKAGRWLGRAGKHLAKAATGKLVSSAIKVAAPAIATALLGPAGAPLGMLVGEVGAKHASSAAEKAVGKKMGVGIGSSKVAPLEYVPLRRPESISQKLKKLKGKVKQSKDEKYAPSTEMWQHQFTPIHQSYEPGKGYGIFKGMSTLRHAGIGTYEAEKALKALSDREFGGRFHLMPNEEYYDAPLAPRSRGTGVHHRGSGLYTGGGLYAGGRSGHGLYGGAVSEVATVGKNGGFVHHLPPALQSQPYSANFHFQFQLPPQYQQYEQGPAVEYY